MFQPFGNATTLPPAEWHPEPHFRGTFNILSTCLLTMFLCVWTAVHLNLPEYQKDFRQILRKTGWLVLGIFAPELVAWNAWEQRRTVKWLTRKMQEQLEGNREDSASQPCDTSAAGVVCTCFFCRFGRTVKLPYRGLVYLLRAAWRLLRRLGRKVKISLYLEPNDIFPEPRVLETKNEPYNNKPNLVWTDRQSWYALMGGYVFDTSTASPAITQEPHGRVTLTPEGILLLAELWPELLPCVSNADIEDKSKQDTLTKFITCWQASWFCIQCISRLANGLAISLLELNVFGHALCTLLIYMLWWNKPKDVKHPTLLTGEGETSVAALLLTLNTPVEVTDSIGNPKGPVNAIYWAPYPPDAPEKEYMIDHRFHMERLSLRAFLQFRYSNFLEDFRNHREDKVEEPRGANIAGCTYLVESLPVVCYQLKELMSPGHLRIDHRDWTLRGSIERRLLGCEIRLDKFTVSRLRAIRHHDQMHDILNRSIVQRRLKEQAVFKRIKVKRFVSARNANWAIDRTTYYLDLKSATEQDADVDYVYVVETIIGLAIATAVYGGLHLVAWAAVFPSETEHLLWRASSLTVCVSGTAFILSFSLLSIVAAALAFLISRFSKRTSAKVESEDIQLPTHSKGTRTDEKTTERSLIAESKTSQFPSQLEEGCANEETTQKASNWDFPHALLLCIGFAIAMPVLIALVVVILSVFAAYFVGVFVLYLCPVIWYVFCRCFLVVECFISLAYLSEAVLHTPQWSNYIPHLT